MGYPEGYLLLVGKYPQGNQEMPNEKMKLVLNPQKQPITMATLHHRILLYYDRAGISPIFSIFAAFFLVLSLICGNNGIF